jgi:hypothetical protein
MTIEYQVHFQKGTRVGTRSVRSVVVNAENLQAAIPLARRLFAETFPQEHATRAYKLRSAWSSEHGLEHLH